MSATDPRRLKILSISAVYPTLEEPNLGIFVKRRLDHMAGLADIQVIAPAPAIDYAKLRVEKAATKPGANSKSSSAGSDQILRPRWWYPPGGTALNPPLMAAQILPAVKRIRRSGFPFDVIDAHFAYPTGVAAALLAANIGVPFTITLRGDETMHVGVSALRARWIDWAFRRATAIFAVSGRLREWAISRGGVPAGRAFTIPNGVDNTIFRLLPDDERDNARKALRLEINATGSDDRIILSVGYLIERKGHHHLIRAVHAAGGGKGGRKTHIVIVGEPGREGSFADQLHELTASLGMQDTVHFLGGRSQQQVATLMNAADLMVLASSREGWPNVVQEALACGCPVVASDIGGTPDMIPDSRYGYLLPPGEVQVGTLMEALDRSTGTNFDRHSIAKWGGRRSWNQVALEVVSRLQDLLPSPQA